MANRKNIWDALDKMEGKKEGSSFKALNKERVRQGYKKEVAKKMRPYGEKKDYKKIDVFHNGKYAHSTTWAKNTKEAIANSGLDGGKITANYSK